MTALDEIRMKVINVIKVMLKTSVCLGQAGLMPRIKPYAIRKAANVSASEMMKIHIMNLLHEVPNGDLPPPQLDASIRCCSTARLESIQFRSPLNFGLRQPQQQKKIQPKPVHDMPVLGNELQRFVIENGQAVRQRLYENNGKSNHAPEQM